MKHLLQNCRVARKLSLLSVSAFCLLANTPAALGQGTPVLSLTPSVATASAGSTVTFTLNLTGGTNIGYYNTSIMIDGAYLSFSGAQPFVSTFSGFDFQGADTVNGTTAKPNLNASYVAFSNPAVNNTDPITGLPLTTALGYFQAIVKPAAPIGITLLSLASASTTVSGSAVVNATGTDNELVTVNGSTLTIAPLSLPAPGRCCWARLASAYWPFADAGAARIDRSSGKPSGELGEGRPPSGQVPSWELRSME